MPSRATVGDVLDDAFTATVQRVNAVKFSAESTVVASASYDQAVMLWDCR
jgi:hypothetical protein